MLISVITCIFSEWNIGSWGNETCARARFLSRRNGNPLALPLIGCIPGARQRRIFIDNYQSSITIAPASYKWGPRASLSEETGGDAPRAERTTRASRFQQTGLSLNPPPEVVSAAAAILLPLVFLHPSIREEQAGSTLHERTHWRPARRRAREP